MVSYKKRLPKSDTIFKQTHAQYIYLLKMTTPYPIIDFLQKLFHNKKEQNFRLSQTYFTSHTCKMPNPIKSTIKITTQINCTYASQYGNLLNPL